MAKPICDMSQADLEKRLEKLYEKIETDAETDNEIDRIETELADRCCFGITDAF